MSPVDLPEPSDQVVHPATPGGEGSRWRQKSTTAGEHIIKELKCLAYLAKTARVELDWKPLDEWIIDFVRPSHRDKLWIEPADLVLFINTLRRLRDADAAERVESYAKRLHMVRQVAEQSVTLHEAAKEAGLSDRAAWKWVKRYKRHGAAGIERRAGWESKTSRVAYAYVLLKATTVMRDVELRDLRVRQIDTREKVIPYLNRSKRKERDAVAVIDDMVVEALTPLLKDKHPEAYVFDIDGRPLGETTLCKITLRAWRKAFYDAKRDEWRYPPQKYLSWIRHNVLTEIIDALGLDAAMALANHTSTKVTEKHYNLDRRKLRVKSKALAATRERFALSPGG